MPLSMAESTNPQKVLNEIKTLDTTLWKDKAAKNNWTVTTFKFTQAPQDFYLKLKTLSKVKVAVKYEGGYKVYLQGEKEKGGWAEQRVGTLPGTAQ
jgi:hypothetical protein